MVTANFTFGLMVTMVVLLIIAVATPYFGCGNILVDCNYGYQVAMKIFFVLGLVCAIVVLILEIISFASVSYRGHSTLSLVRLILLAIAVGSLIISILIFTSYHYVWSYMLAIVAMTIGLQLLILAFMTSSCVVTSRSTGHVVVRETVVTR